MKSLLSGAGLRCSLFAVLMAGSLLVAQEKKPEAKVPAAAKKSVNRLPNNFAKLSLSDEQKKKILDIQAANDPKIAELTAQLNALKDKEQADVEAVLTPDQSKLLAEIKAAKKKSDDDKAAAKAKGGDKKPDVTVTPAEPIKKDAEKKPATEKKP